MVPGMTERERRANDARRIEWLAGAYFGRASATRAPDGAHNQALLLLRLKRPFPSLRDFGLRASSWRGKFTRPLPGRGALPFA